MPPGVPGECGHPIAKPDAITFQPLGNAERAAAHLTVICAVKRAFDGPTDDLPPRVLDGGVVHYLMHQ
jgi:hypothetical protein